MPNSNMPSTRSARAWRAAAVLLVLLLSAVCAQAQSQSPPPADPLVDRILQPPMRSMPRIERAWDALLPRIGSRHETVLTDDGVRIAYTVIEPGAFALRPRLSFDRKTWDFDVVLEPKNPAARPPAVEGTVVATHGWGLDARSVLPWAVLFGQRGYRTVLVDLRGHGRSGSSPITFGHREALDLAAVIRELRRQQRVREPLALFGVSYGAVAAIHAAADPKVGVDALIAMEPFTNAGDAVRRMGGFAKEGGSGSWRKRLAAWWARTKISNEQFESALDRASQRIGTDLRTLDTAPALARVPVCTLLIQGGADTLVDLQAVRAMARATAARVVYAEAPKEGHLTLPARVDWLGQPVADWLDAALTNSADSARPACPAIKAAHDSRRRQSLESLAAPPT